MSVPLATKSGPSVSSLLGTLRKRIRAQVVWHGLASLAVLAGALFWLSIGIDWLFEPPRAVRIAILALAGASGAAAIYWLLLRKLSARLSDANLALVIERKFPQFQESLITAVQLSGRKSTGVWHQQMLAETMRRARESLRLIELDEALNASPATRRGVWGVTLLASVMVFAVAMPDLFSVWRQRALGLAEIAWPRRTLLHVVGLGPDNTFKVARGGDLTLLVQADTERQVPERVEVRYDSEDGARGREWMDRIGRAIPGQDRYQDFSYTFAGVLSSRGLDILGGDARLRDVRIEVVEMPALETMTLECEYPDYTGRSQRSLPAAGATQLPQGTRVTLTAVASKALEWAEITVAAGQQSLATERVKPTTKDRRRVTFALEPLQADTTLLVKLHDTDGIENREPLRLALTVLPDAAPTINAQLAGIGTAVTPQAQLPMRGQVTDDYGVADVRFDYAIDEEPSQERGIYAAATEERTPPANRPLAAALDLREMSVKPGQKIAIGLKARDNYTLAETPHDAVGERYVLEIVTAEDLLQLLQTRELGLRRRFETLIDEVTSLRDSLPELAAVPEDDDGNDTQVGLALAIQRITQLSRKDAQETLGVSASFADMREELDNNRIDNSELKERLQTRIADPLKRVGEERFPELDQGLELIRTAAADNNARRVAVDAAVKQADGLLIEMHRVLDQMMELESLNEAVALLRQIIAGQDKVTEETKHRRTENARRLLEE